MRSLFERVAYPLHLLRQSFTVLLDKYACSLDDALAGAEVLFQFFRLALFLSLSVPQPQAHIRAVSPYH